MISNIFPENAKFFDREELSSKIYSKNENLQKYLESGSKFTTVIKKDSIYCVVLASTVSLDETKLKLQLDEEENTYPNQEIAKETAILMAKMKNLEAVFFSNTDISP